MNEISYQIENFTGPLDLLLFLISKHKVELWEIKIYEIIDQYLKIVSEINEETLDYSSDFVDMAARLVLLKSIALLPRQKEQPEEIKELIGQLIELRLAKIAAENLKKSGETYHRTVRAPMEIKIPFEYTYSHEKEELRQAYLTMVTRNNARDFAPDLRNFDEIVNKPVIPVGTKILHILRRLKKGIVKTLSGLFKGVKDRSDAVVTFLGLLELVRAGRVRVSDDGSMELEKKNGNKQ